MTIKYELLLKNGEVIDPGDKRRGRYDVGFTNGVVAAVEENIPAEEARETIDVSGKLVTPGLIDTHGHFFTAISRVLATRMIFVYRPA